MSKLRKKLLHLAATEPELRKAVVGLLRTADLTFISNAARKAFDAELLPQAEASAHTPEQVETVRSHLHSLLDDALREKNHLYLLLIRYKSNDAGDAAYFDDLKKATDEWASNQGAAPAPEPAPAPAPPPPAPAPAPAPAPVPVVMPQMPMMPPQIVMAPMPVPAPAPPPPAQPSTTTTTITTVKTGRER